MPYLSSTDRQGRTCMERLPDGTACGQPAPFSRYNRFGVVEGWSCDEHRPPEKGEVQKTPGLEIVDGRGNVVARIMGDERDDLRFRVLNRR